MKTNIKNIVFDMGSVLLEYTPTEYSHMVITDPKADETEYRELFDGDEWKHIDAGAITEEEANNFASFLNVIIIHISAVKIKCQCLKECKNSVTSLIGFSNLYIK